MIYINLIFLKFKQGIKRFKGFTVFEVINPQKTHLKSNLRSFLSDLRHF